jgi:Ca2+-binding RTX toxin-like protein
MLGFALLGILGVGLIFEAFDSDDNQSSNDDPQPEQPPVEGDPIEPPVDPGDQPELTTQTGTNGANDMDLTEGNDKAFGRGGEDLINGQGGEDSIFGGNASDTILGEKGDDFLRGSGSGDLVLGGEGNDVVRGDSGNDTLFGADLLSEQEIIAAYRAGEDPDLNQNLNKVGQTASLVASVMISSQQARMTSWILVLAKIPSRQGSGWEPVKPLRSLISIQPKTFCCIGMTKRVPNQQSPSQLGKTPLMHRCWSTGSQT